MASQASVAHFDVTQITRPAPVLMTYYVLCALVTGPACVVAIIPLWFRYVTLRYRFDDEGVSMSWGVIFRREVQLTYRRIQDIHLSANVVQRWLGIANVGIQTASGSSSPEMTIEGLLEPERLRDFLYTKMRGVHSDHALPTAPAPPAGGEVSVANGEVDRLLRDIRDALETAARRLERRS
jgi:putative membrane protein